MEALKLYRGGSPVFRSLFNDMWGDDWFQPVVKNSVTPAVNIKETENEYLIDVAAPGIAKENFKISVENEMLTISAEKESNNEEKDKEGRYTRREFSYQNFSRTLVLPEGEVDTNKIEANYDNGVLKISLPKKAEAKPQPIKYVPIN